MNVSKILGIAVFALCSAIASADQPGQYPYPQQQLPMPIDQYPPDQTIYCPPGTQMAPPVLPYPGPQVRVVPMRRPFRTFCRWSFVGPGMAVIQGNGIPGYIYGPAPFENVLTVLDIYIQNDTCVVY